MPALYTSDPTQRDKLMMEISRVTWRMKFDPKLQNKSGLITFGFGFEEGIVEVVIDMDFIRHADHFTVTDMIYNEVVAALSPKH